MSQSVSQIVAIMLIFSLSRAEKIKGYPPFILSDIIILPSPAQLVVRSDTNQSVLSSHGTSRQSQC